VQYTIRVEQEAVVDPHSVMPHDDKAVEVSGEVLAVVAMEANSMLSHSSWVFLLNAIAWALYDETVPMELEKELVGILRRSSVPVPCRKLVALALEDWDERKSDVDTNDDCEVAE
jgi:hypothetical protein